MIFHLLLPALLQNHLYQKRGVETTTLVLQKTAHFPLVEGVRVLVASLLRFFLALFDVSPKQVIFGHV